MNNMNVVLLTRIKTKDQDELKRFNEWLDVFKKHTKIEKIFIVLDEGTKLTNQDDRVKLIKHNNPTCPTAMNKVIRENLSVCEPKAFIIASKEVKIGKIHINTLISQVDNYLCVGYKFKIAKKCGKISEELDSYYKNESQIAYMVPWNTCIIWNYERFRNHIVKFDEICNKNPFGKLIVCIDGTSMETKYQGMEDGLAIARGASKGLKYKLLSKPSLWWEIKKEKDQILRNRIKLARKTEVLLNFMAVRNFSIRDLINAIKK